VLISKKDSKMPDFTAENWRLIKTLTIGGFTYHFYHDIARPQLMVAAMTVAGELPRVGKLTRLSWQVGDSIRTVRLELDEAVRENSVIAKDGKRYELDGIMDRLSKKSDIKLQ